MEIKNVEELKAAYPEFTAHIAEQATATERKRIQDIEGVSLPGFEGVIDKAKFEAPATAAEVAMNIIAEQKKQGTAYLAAATEDAKNSGVNEVVASGHEGGTKTETNPYDAAIDNVFPAVK